MSHTIDDRSGGDSSYRGIRLDKVGELIKHTREKKGLSVRQLASILGDGTHFTTISKIEKGRMVPTLPWITKLSSALGVPFLELITGVHAEEGAVAIPLYDYDDFAMREKQTGWLGTNYVGENAFAIEASIEEKELKKGIRLFLVVNPDDFPPEEGWIYCLSVRDEMMTGIYRLDPPRFVPWRSTKTDPLIVGRSPFEFVGRIVRVIENV